MSPLIAEHVRQKKVGSTVVSCPTVKFSRFLMDIEQEQAKIGNPEHWEVVPVARFRYLNRRRLFKAITVDTTE